MKTTTLRRTGALALAAALSLGVSACGSSSSDNSPANASAKSGSSSTMAENAGTQTFGPGCKLIPKNGAGSFNGMATAPVATAASANPLLTTLVAAVGKAGLADTLNSAKSLTVFAPTDDAFNKIPKKALAGVLADKATLTKILTHHVIAGKLSPSQLAGTHKTLAGDTVTVKGSGSNFTVDGAKVLCGNIPTANATVYVIDSVLMP
ncbi:fasciclin domain-containing protein [Nocardioides terrisoli]|uniref:fasciclin domain-containing protein n=1 Tax=Nocardioides terrisoli TaxID=3388267 RepID=UPI00287B8F4D|nr:fasciclin domain-containing protein [Nocardioides marmorisolisilvae]